jgi:hypothetical protein
LKGERGRRSASRFTVFDLSVLQKHAGQLKGLPEAIGVGELAGQTMTSPQFHPGNGLFFVKGTPADTKSSNRP